MFVVIILCIAAGLTQSAAQQSASSAQPAAPAQDDETRSEAIERQRRERQGKLAPVEPDPLEQRIVGLKNSPWLNGLLGGRNGFQLTIGRMIPGAGFAIGPQYTSPELLGGRLQLRTRAAVSTRRFYSGEVEASLPHLLNGSVFLDSRVGYRNYAAVDYYGPGPDSRREGRSNYRLEAVDIVARPGIRILPRFAVGGIGAYRGFNVGPGSASNIASAERLYSPAVAPGIDTQSSFVQGGGFAEFDWRKGGSEPLGGGKYSVEYSRMQDRQDRGFTHNRLDMDVQHYIPFFNERRMIALNGASTLTYSPKGNQVPFYVQPVLGGGDGLRGYRPFRFYGDNSLLLNAEYRWEAGLGLDMAVFVDAGKVFDRRSQLNLHDLKYSPGIGLRFKSRQNLLMRLDTAFSNEGVQVWFRFSNIF